MDSSSSGSSVIRQPGQPGLLEQAPQQQAHLHQQQQQQRQQQQLCNTSCSNQNSKNKKLFPQKLWDLINDHRYNFCLRWSDDGQLVYLNRDDFEDSYLKTAENQFHTQKAISFVRQMNMYGFKKVDDCYYENDNFKRDCEHLLKNMIRKHPNKNIPTIAASGQEARIESPFIYRSNSSSAIFESFHSAQIRDNNPTLASGRESDRIHDQGSPRHFHNNNQPFSGNKLPSPRNFNMNFVVPTSDTSCLNEPDSQLPNTFPSYNQKELINALILQQQQQQQQQQQSNTQSARDLTTSTENPLNLQQANCNLNMFYAILSTINNNLYLQNNNHGLAFDINKFQNLQQIYQNLSVPLDRSTPTNQRTHESVTSPPHSIKISDEAASNTSSLDKETSSTSLLAKKKNLIKSGRCLEMFENGFGNSCHQTATEKLLENQSTTKKMLDFETIIKRRDYRSNRSFKRSADSILDSNNNNNNDGGPEKAIDISKKIKLDNNPKLTKTYLDRNVNKYAKNLVTEKALARNARVDMNVICEASKYTEHFVDILFDTAQVIARHSNDSGLGSDPVIAKNQDTGLHVENNDFNKDKEFDRPNQITFGDLTSALKLLPSKLLKILK